MVEEKFYCRLTEEKRKRQRHLGESRVDMTLGHVRSRDGRGESGSKVRKPKRNKGNPNLFMI